MMAPGTIGRDVIPIHPAGPALVDPHRRRLSYLRLSITELCNYRCQYCLPRGCPSMRGRDPDLSVDEIAVLVKGMAAMGMRKVRITGGEPTLRRDLVDIIELVANEPGVRSVALTTNGHKLARNIDGYIRAGLDRINVSVDSFDPETFRRITGKDECLDILKALDGLMEKGFEGIKINTLILKESFEDNLKGAFAYVKDRPVALRFIELMQTGDNLDYFNRQHVKAGDIGAMLERDGWTLVPRGPDAGPAKEYEHPDHLGRIGFIAPYSKDFCKTCNRLRVDSLGRMQLCLFGGVRHDLRSFLTEADVEGLMARVGELVGEKPEHHYLQGGKVGLIRDLSMIGG